MKSKNKKTLSRTRVLYSSGTCCRRRTSLTLGIEFYMSHYPDGQVNSSYKWHIYLSDCDNSGGIYNVQIYTKSQMLYEKQLKGGKA